MADPSPLLPAGLTSPEPPPADFKAAAAPTLDDAIEQSVGSFGPAQLIQALLVSFAWVFDAQQTFINVFTDAQPSWHCTRPDDAACATAAAPCNLPAASWAWDGPATASVVSEWGLLCASPLVVGLPQSSFFAGCLAGGLLLSTLADSTLGRKKMLFFACLIMSATGTLTAAAQNLWVYSALRFVSGFGRATIGTCALVLSSEIVGKQWRGQVGVISFFCFTLGFLSLPAIAYLARAFSWRLLYLCISLPAMLYCAAVYFFVHESPKWLFVRGRKEDAIQTLESIATSNGKMLLSSFSRVPMEEELPGGGSAADLYSALKILWDRWWSLRRLTMAMVVAFGVGVVYYGMPLGAGSLDVSLYLSVTLNALAELPSALLSFFILGKLSRRRSVIFFTALSGVCSVLCVVVGGGDWKVLQMGLELVAFFSVCTSLNIVLIYSLELFPTCVRNSALAMVRQAAVMGGVLSPALVAAGRKDEFWSFGVFGLVIGGCGLFVIGLPETRGGPSYDTMEEEEKRMMAEAVLV
ncbi:hypothetical protein ACLOJK_029874 [Asimina triloba]